MEPLVAWRIVVVDLSGIVQRGGIVDAALPELDLFPRKGRAVSMKPPMPPQVLQLPHQTTNSSFLRPTTLATGSRKMSDIEF